MYKILNTAVFLLISLIAMTALPVCSAAEEVRVAIVKSRDLPPYQEAINGIQEGLKTQGISPAVDTYDLKGNLKMGEKISEKIRQKGARLIFTVGTEAETALKPFLKETPRIASMVYEPSDDKSGNRYGVYLRVEYSDYFSALKKMLPDLKRIAFLETEDAASTAGLRREAHKNGIDASIFKLDDLKRFHAVLRQARGSSDALAMTLAPKIYNQSTAKELLLFSLRNKYPIIAYSPNYVRSGALLSIASDFKVNGIEAGEMGSLLLKGETPPKRFVPTRKLRIVWNAQIAKTFGISPSRRAKGMYETV